MSELNPSGREVPEFIQKKGELQGFNGMKEKWHQTTKGSHLHYYVNAPGVGPSDGPVMILAHGFPQTSYIFRYLIPALQHNFRLFVPDHPGIAYSSDAESQDKYTLGACYVEGLVSHYGKGSKVILGGHDRGARVMQRLAVSHKDFPDIEAIGVFMLDIVPIVAQFACFADPKNTSRYFHWSLLPVQNFAVPMIMAFGGDKWCRELHKNAGGQNEEGIKSLYADDGVEVSAAWYARKDTNDAAARDYTAAANEDWDRMVEDQKSGKKIEIPTLVMYGIGLAKMHDVEKVWPEYVKEGTPLQMHAAGNGYGHYLSEECPDWVTKQIEGFVETLGK